jgi:hypothetical protein
MVRRYRGASEIAGGVVGLCLITLAAHAGTITETDRITLLTNLGVGTTVETFGSNAQFPITTGTLNSSTNLVVTVGPPITPGEIQPGVTYSTPIGTGNFFNIDGGAGFSGGFLDSVFNPGFALTATFDNPTQGFGLDTSQLMGTAFTIDINFTGGPDFTDTLSIPGGFPGFGFESSGQDIVSATILGNSGTFSFAVDNFTFGLELSSPTPIPEPASLTILGAALVGLGFLRRRGNSPKVTICL